MQASLLPLGLYIHLPWCLSKCPYCDFNSHAVSSRSLSEDLQKRYIQALMTDLELALPMVWGRQITALFIGGGTPSLFSPKWIEVLLSQVRALLPLSPGIEITLEANPGSFERARFADYLDAGVNRLSIGVQTFHNKKLQAIGRMHDSDQARSALEEVALHFDNFNIDLMYALPQQTLSELEEDLQIALSYTPPHLSIYHLTLEPHTVFAKYPPLLPDNDTAYRMLDLITQITSNYGMQRYEVSAFAQSEKFCKHNMNYWQFGDYLGIGAGAHSKISISSPVGMMVTRQVRFSQPQKYIEQVAISKPVRSHTVIKRSELPFEFMLNALRLSKGFSIQDYVERTGLLPGTIESPLQEAVSRGLITRQAIVGQEYIKTTPHGFDFMNDLLILFLPD
jgi:oxygen-independent coproporphyrinogen-3 oxidase